MFWKNVFCLHQLSWMSEQVVGALLFLLPNKIPSAEVCAWDLSADALLVAKENAVRLDATVSFSQQDMLQPDETVLAELDHRVDVLVSNPPYVRELERDTMASQVLDHEPHMALFVPNQDALWPYKALARIGNRLLKPTALAYGRNQPIFIQGN